jgi:hypothetical protein
MIDRSALGRSFFFSVAAAVAILKASIKDLNYWLSLARYLFCDTEVGNLDAMTTLMPGV